MAGVTFEGAGKVYKDGTRALEALDLAIEDGEFMVLVGPVRVRQDDRVADGGGTGGDQRGLDPRSAITSSTSCAIRATATSPWCFRTTRCTRT